MPASSRLSIDSCLNSQDEPSEVYAGSVSKQNNDRKLKGTPVLVSAKSDVPKTQPASLGMFFLPQFSYSKLFACMHITSLPENERLFNLESIWSNQTASLEVHVTSSTFFNSDKIKNKRLKKVLKNNNFVILMPPFYLEFRGLIISITFNNRSVYKLISLFIRNATRKQCSFKVSGSQSQRWAPVFFSASRSCRSEQDQRINRWRSLIFEPFKSADIIRSAESSWRSAGVLHLQELGRDEHDLLRWMQRVVPLPMHGHLTCKFKLHSLYFLWCMTQLFIIWLINQILPLG